MNTPFDITILGTSSATPTRSRHPSSQYIKLDGHHLLIDCGEGTQRQLLRHGLRAGRISHIFISHLHGDHFFGLPGLISTLNLNGHREALHIVGPAALQEAIELLLRLSDVTLAFPLHFIPTQTDGIETVYETAECKVESVPLQHRIPCTGFIVREKTAARKLNREACNEHDVPYQAYESLLQGADFYRSDGTLIANAALTYPGRKARSYAYISDTLYLPELSMQLRDIDLLYHESTFDSSRSQRAAETFHSTAAQAAAFARDCGVGQLLLGHFSARYRETDILLEEACAVFPNSRIAEEGETYSPGESAV
jgi:ribonuclease Z